MIEARASARASPVLGSARARGARVAYSHSIVPGGFDVMS
jgi:hypothetical protein